MYLPAGYVKLEGGTVNRSNYPRLVALADTYSLWTDDPTANPGLFGEGDGTTTMVLPNWTGRMAQFAATAGGKIDAGLPNIVDTGKTAFYVYKMPDGSIYMFPPFSAAIDSGVTSVKGTNNVRDVATLVYTAFDASISNSIYSASTTVQPPAINTFAIMRY